jgi:acetyl esterase/lipase
MPTVSFQSFIILNSMKTISNLVGFLVVVFFSNACKKNDKAETKSFLQGESTNIRYRDSVFANVDTTSLFNIFYRKVNNYNRVDSLKLDVYQPAGDTDPKRAAIIFIHGGGFGETARSKGVNYNTTNLRKTVTDICLAYAKRGYVVISPSYRVGIDPSGNPAIVNDQLNKIYETIYRATQDIRALVRFVKLGANIGRIDTNKIFIGGGSAGAITALHANYLDPTEAPNGFGIWGALDGTGEYDYPGPSNKTLGVVNIEGMLINTSFIDYNEGPIVSTYGISDLFYYGTSTSHPPYPNLQVSFSNGLQINAQLTKLGVTPIATYVYNPGNHGASSGVDIDSSGTDANGDYRIVYPLNAANTINFTSNWMYNRLLAQ